MFIKISHNRLKNCRNVAKMLCGTPKSRHFSAFLSHFSKIIFEKRLFRQFQRLALAASGRDADEARKRNPAEVLKPLKKRGDSHLSVARFGRRTRFAVSPKYTPELTLHLRHLLAPMKTTLQVQKINTSKTN
jgi:hypothetical protein